MMAADNMAAKPKSKEESQSSSSRKATTSQRPQEQALKCPRCDSANTKFCYYNNYSLTQPRHFCKTCRRYWTKGGALRNVPMGGGCRKNKKMKSSSSSKLSGDHSRDSSTSSDIGGLKFFHGFSSPAMDFQLGGLSFSRLQPSSTTGVYNNQFSSFGDISTTTDAIASSPCFTLDPSGNTGPPLLGFNFPLPSLLKQGENSASFGGGVVQEMGSVNVHSNIASSIESLSSINQDMHWKLQQQRFAMLFGAENQKDHNSVSSSLPLENQIQKPQPILFQNLDISKAEEDCVAAAGNSRKEGTSNSNLATEWFFDNSYAPSVNPTPTNNSNANENGSSWNGVQAWSNLNQFSTLP